MSEIPSEKNSKNQITKPSFDKWDIHSFKSETSAVFRDLKGDWLSKLSGNISSSNGHSIRNRTDSPSGISTRYAKVNIAELIGTNGDDYSNALETLLQLHKSRYGGPSQSSLTDKPYLAGGIIGIVGSRGTGKTHMACGLVNLFNLACFNSGKFAYGNSRYRRALDIFSDIKASFGGSGNSRGQKQDEIVQELVEADLLVIDELQVKSDSAWEDNLLTNIIDRRYAEVRPTVLISNLTRDGLIESVGDSVASRMMETGRIIEATWSSFRIASRQAGQQ